MSHADRLESPEWVRLANPLRPTASELAMKRRRSFPTERDPRATEGGYQREGSRSTVITTGAMHPLELPDKDALGQTLFPDFAVRT